MRLGLNVQELPDVIGISRASLFSYRTGNRPLSSKAWRKLEAAEKEAGISTEGNKGNGEKQSYGVPEAPPGDPAIIHEPACEYPGMARIEALLLDIQARLIRLENQTRKEPDETL